MHQDCYGSDFCMYDGFPKWLQAKRSPPAHAYPWPFPPSTPNCSMFWEQNCLTEAAASAYQDIYNNYAGMADSMAKFWAHSASIFSEIESVLGYELVNEPFAGNVYEDPLLFLPALAGKQNLLPLCMCCVALVSECANTLFVTRCLPFADQMTTCRPRSARWIATRSFSTSP